MKTSKFDADALRGAGKKKILGLSVDDIIRYFFGGNALVALIVLALITIFLFREGAGFFPQYRKDLALFKASGMDYVALMRDEIDRYAELNRKLNQVNTELSTKYYAQGLEFEQVREKVAPVFDYIQEFRAAVVPLRDITREAENLARETKEQVTVSRTNATNPSYEGPDVLSPEQEQKLLTETREQLASMAPAFNAANREFASKVENLLTKTPQIDDEDAQKAMAEFKSAGEDFVKSLDESSDKLAAYDPEQGTVGLGTAIVGFVFGTQWITNSSWQDFYGMIPLLSGSLLVTVIALLISVPLGVCSAIYINQFAGSTEQNFIKPYIEFISAIPSVVIGFFGIAVFGTSIRWLSQQPWMDWVPFFPVDQRLNAFTAGGLLALMAVPTIFTLSEDAINNVPKAFKEASVAMGATRFQTVVRIIVPTALSGIIAAILLGFGRVIGETMVVLLCAGNRIAIPEVTQGLGVFFQPVHTMTGIIAQEMGEVTPGSIHYRALFCVGIALFFLSLVINYSAQVIVRKYKISAG